MHFRNTGLRIVPGSPPQHRNPLETGLGRQVAEFGDVHRCCQTVEISHVVFSPPLRRPHGADGYSTLPTGAVRPTGPDPKDPGEAHWRAPDGRSHPGFAA